MMSDMPLQELPEALLVVLLEELGIGPDTAGHCINDMGEHVTYGDLALKSQDIIRLFREVLAGDANEDPDEYWESFLLTHGTPMSMLGDVG